MENINPMGSKVQDGYKCKPVVRDSQKPIMYYKSHILVCTGKRCQPENENDIDLPNYLRDLLRNSNMNRGKDRIKVTQVGCFGACRFRKVALFYTNSNDHLPINNALWLRKVHKLADSQWNDVFDCLVSNKSVIEHLGKDFLIPMEELN